MTAVSLDSVALLVGGRTILAEVTGDIAQGEFVGVLGANGAGKTTLMKAILGLIPVRSGTIRVLGKPVSRGNPAVGYLPQTQALQPSVRLSGRDFIAASLRGHRWGLPIKTGDDRSEIDRCLGLVGATEFAGRPIAAMSGGERQRLLIAEALIGAPPVLLLDEPLIGLDPHQQKVIVDLVRDLANSLDLAVLFTAHELNQVLGAIDRVLYLGQGQAALGSVDEVVEPGVLSRLYGAPIDVVRAAGHIFVMSAGRVVERDQHHDHAH